MQATILDLRRRMPAVLRALDRHERVTILYRGKERAVLVPSGTPSASRDANQAASHPAFGMWADHVALADVAVQVRNLRRSRVHAL